MAYLRARENMNETSEYQKVPFVTVVIMGATLSIFTLAVLLMKLRFRANFWNVGNIRVAPPALAVLPQT